MIKNLFLDFKKKPLALWIILVLFLLMFRDTFFAKKQNDFIFAFLPVAWFWVNRRFKIDARFSIVSGLCFLFICPFLMLFNEYLAMRAGVWAFLLLFLGTISFSLEFKESKGEG